MTHFFHHGSSELGVVPDRRDDYLDFSVNTNPWGTPKVVYEILEKSLSRIEHYPDLASQELKQELAILHGICSDNILVGNGSSELIYVAAQLRRQAQAFLYLPTFSEYERALRANESGISFSTAKENGTFYFLLRDRAIQRKISQSDIVFLGNPNNPTGSLVSRIDLVETIDSNPKALFVIDEVFMDFSESDQSVIKEAVHRKNLIVIRSLTKTFSIPGLRLGYAVAPPETIFSLAQRQPPWSVNSLAEVVGKELIKHRDYVEDSKQKIQQAYLRFFEALSTIPWLRPYPSHANFILCRILDERISSSLLQKELLSHQVLIRNCDNFRGLEKRRFIRLAVRREEENEKLVRILNSLSAL